MRKTKQPDFEPVAMCSSVRVAAYVPIAKLDATRAMLKRKYKNKGRLVIRWRGKRRIYCVGHDGRKYYESFCIKSNATYFSAYLYA